MNRNIPVRCGVGEKIEIVSNSYLSLLDCILWDVIAVNTASHCKKGDIISVRGRVQSRVYEKDGEKKYIQEIVGERVSFISSVREKEENTVESDNS